MIRKAVLVAMLLSATPTFAATILNHDSVVVEEQQLVELKHWVKEGASAIDTYPADRPDGWVTKADSPYYDAAVADLGQVKLYQDMFARTLKKYPGYVDGSWRGYSWDDLSNYRKMLQHLTNENSVTQVGWRIKIRFNADVSVTEHYDWQPSEDGFGGDTIAVFSEDRVEVNTKYLFGDIDAGSVRLDSTPPQLWLDLFVPKSDEDAFGQFLSDLEQWNNTPSMDVSESGGVTTYSR